ncbi:unnamed protein product [Linum tenue]|uniref:Uncharacterized protein n=1 Tax=Linum tenue TaxID=586396 RepID=A0AAV0MX42_9ROSI|nr:unnamed protein product [Linum tenue]
MLILLMLEVLVYDAIGNDGNNNPAPQAFREMIVRVTPVNEDV